MNLYLVEGLLKKLKTKYDNELEVHYEKGSDNGVITNNNKIYLTNNQAIFINDNSMIIFE